MTYIYTIQNEGRILDILVAAPAIALDYLKNHPEYAKVFKPAASRGGLPPPHRQLTDQQVRQALEEGAKLSMLNNGVTYTVTRSDRTILHDLTGPLKRAVGEVGVRKGLPQEVQKNIRGMIGLGTRRRSRKSRK